MFNAKQLLTFTRLTMPISMTCSTHKDSTLYSKA